MKILITAGPTRERIDPVRFLSNRSTGKMGYALAAAAAARGHDVVLVSGPTALAAPDGVRLVPVESAAEMAEVVHCEAAKAHAVIMAAAVADYRPRHPLGRKLKKGPGDLTLELERTEDILAGLGRDKRPGQILVGFAAETHDVVRHAREKLARKGVPLVVGNIGPATFGQDDNALLLVDATGHRELPHASKRTLARQLVAEIAQRLP